MRIRERYELAEELRTRYRGAGRVEKGELLDSFCLASGYGRKYAVKVLRDGGDCRCHQRCPANGEASRPTPLADRLAVGCFSCSMPPEH